MQDKPVIVIFTGSYPHKIEAEESFLNPEIKYVSLSFARIIIVPEFIGGNRQSLAPGIEIDESYAENYAKYRLSNRLGREAIAFSFVFRSSLLFQEILKYPLMLFSLRKLKRLLSFIVLAIRVRNWTCNFIKTKNIDLENTIFYTYWFNHISAGIGLTRKMYPRIKIVSRAHNADLYEERYQPAYIPCRHETLSALDKLFLISENGRDYLFRRYPLFAGKYEVSRLGVEDAGFLSECQKDGIFRILSCSFITAVKRPDLLLTGMRELALLRPRQKFEWYHIGDGPLRPYIEELAKKILPGNIEFHCLGRLPNNKAILFYKNNAVDVFVNVSSFEGIPVSIMEAQNCAIPVIAAGVGGTPEIVSDKVGVLLGSNPQPEEIAEAICSLLDNPELAKEKRNASRINWESNFCADKNYADFSRRLKLLLAK